jgi:hypothetical protein
MDLVTKQQSLELLRGKRGKKLRPSLFIGASNAWKQSLASIINVLKFF